MSNSSLSQTFQKHEAQRKERQQKRVKFQTRIAALRQTFHPQPTLHINSHHCKVQKQQGTYLNSQSHVEREHNQKNNQSDNDNNQQYASKNTTSYITEEFRGPIHRPNTENTSQVAREEVNLSTQADQSEIQLLLNQRMELLNQIVQLQNEEKNRLNSFKSIIQQIKEKYLGEFQKMKTAADQRTKQLHDKVLKIRIQIQASNKKNDDLQKANQVLKSEIIDGNQAMGKSITQIKQSYAKKIEEVEKIFNSSNDKIQSFQKDFNEDQLVQNTLSNEQFLQNMEVSAKQAQKGQGLLQQYKNLMSGKKEILNEIKITNTNKEEQLKKLGGIEKKMIDLSERLKADQNMLLRQNEKISQELQEIMQLIMGKA